MASSSRGRRTTEFGVVSGKWKEREISPERHKTWTEPKSLTNAAQRKVSVVYYLSRNGLLEHPHFMEVPLSSNHGLYLKDVINRLNLLRGKGMATLYSWSCKRSYKNGFVWHDLADNDFVYPSNESSSFRLTKPSDGQKSDKDHDFPSIRRRRNQSWSSIDLHEYRVYKAESSSESARGLAADASTQTDDKRRRKPMVKQTEIEELQSESQELEQNQTSELNREEISPPPSDSSPETLESLMKADGRLKLCNGGGGGNEDNLYRTAEGSQSGRMKASSVLMQLISCGSISFKDCGPCSERDQGFSLIGHYKSRLPRGAGDCSHVRKEGGIERDIGSFSR
ncbi:transcription factor MYB59-like [Hibiscus syriacus]|uniref:Transcription factor MYB59-like n=1 Tax=Hibiscus syriacus TaxID=106335 RepID=A0A6A3B935_HIBSY|nr:transcription factor MYB59-like [Hibiscus syriacus]